MKIRPVGAKLLQTDGHDKANGRFIAISRTHLETCPPCPCDHHQCYTDWRWIQPSPRYVSN